MMIGAFRKTVLAAVAAVAFVSYATEEQVLYWMVQEDARAYNNVTGVYTPIRDFFSAYASENGVDNEFGARVRVIGGGGDVFLDLYDAAMGGTLPDSGQFGVGFSTVDGVWGAGSVVGNQSLLGDVGSPEYSFMVELGNYVWDDSTETLSWVTVAASERMDYSSLGDYIHPTFSTGVPGMMVWTPTFFTIVPEPSALLLLLIGGGMISLKRRRFP